MEDRVKERGTVLIVNDEPLVLSSLRLALLRSGFQVVTAVNGEDALTKLTDSYDVVVLDIVMPKMGGQETLRRIRALHPQIPVVGMSGFSKGEAEERFGSHPDAFLQKPFTGSRLVEEITAVLKSRKNNTQIH